MVVARRKSSRAEDDEQRGEWEKLISREDLEVVRQIAKRIDQLIEADIATGKMTRERMLALRHNAVVRGMAEGQLMGMGATPELMADAQLWAKGKLTAEEVVDRLIKRSVEAGEVA